MKSRTSKQVIVWCGVLIAVGLLLLVDQFMEISPWVWVLMLAVAGLGALGLYLADRSDVAMLLPTYVLWAIALLITLVSMDVLREEAVAIYVLTAIALPFLAVFYFDRTQWPMLIPAYVLLAVAVMLALMGLGVLDDLLVPAFVLLAIALPFFVVYARNRSQWWLLIPGGILAAVGLSFLIAEAAAAVIGALVLVVIGVVILVRVFVRREPAGEGSPSEPDVTGAGPEESDRGSQA